MGTFDPADTVLGEELFAKGEVGFPLFSGGTYQVGVAEEWPFLQFGKEGELSDFFCTCTPFEKKRSCHHLPAALLQIYRGHKEPLHVRFERSLWRVITEFYARRIGYGIDLFRSEKGKYSLNSKKAHFTIEPLADEAKKRLYALFYEREEEREENSLKFSNLSEQELARFRARDPSSALRYELSFWSDLAKWWMELQEKGEVPKVTFSGKEGVLPDAMSVSFGSVQFSLALSENLWEAMIPALENIDSTLHLFSCRHLPLGEVSYKGQQLVITYRDRFFEEGETRGKVGEWLYLPGKGFLTERYDFARKAEILSGEEVASFFSFFGEEERSHLAGVSISSGVCSARYDLFFDESRTFHIEPYLFEKGDLQKKGASLFGQWAYLPDKGFVQVTGLLFPEKSTLIPLSKLSEFLQAKRFWLSEQPGFELHLASLRRSVQFSVDELGLHLTPRLGPSEEVSLLDLGNWIYLEGAGFYPKKGGGFEIPIEKTVPPDLISSFIDKHREPLETVKGFFAFRSPIWRVGIDVLLDEQERITTIPKIVYHPDYLEKKVELFGDYSYVAGEGFSLLPKTVPIGFATPRIIPRREELKFVREQLPSLHAHLLHVDPRILPIEDLRLEVRHIEKEGQKKGAYWNVELVFVSKRGEIPAHQVWEALYEKKTHLFTSAGLLNLRDDRFSWWKSLPEGRFSDKGRLLQLLPLEWLRLMAYEEIEEPRAKNSEAETIRQLLSEFASMKTDVPIDLTGFLSKLRSYQYAGVEWLWFLYQNGLSGFLCDEMGLGKTHQALALIAAAANASKGETTRFLVVCPTSVIYHWQGILRRFFPSLPVALFHGPSRRLEGYQKKGGILLTSYGLVRTEKKKLSTFSFDVAVYDEIHVAKNPKSQTHRSLKEISSTVRIGLTGTPIENRIGELKSLFDVVVPGFLPSDAVFREEFLVPIEQGESSEKRNLLSRWLRPFILRRSKKEVLVELPEKIEEISYCDLSPLQEKLYTEIYSQTQKELLPKLRDAGADVPYVHIFAILSKLKQICDHPGLVLGDTLEEEEGTSGKWDLFVELLREARESGLKVVVFSQYLKMLDRIEAHLSAEEIGFAGIRGSTRNREGELTRFANDPKCEVFVASLQAAGVGIDLVAASVVIHYDRWWNPAREDQATDRVHRIGQNRGVQVFKLVTKGTIEEHIHNLIEKKRHLLEQIVGYDDKEQVKLFNREELIELLSLSIPKDGI